MVQSDQTPLLSPATVQKLDTGGYDDDDNPLSDCSDYKASDDDQEMAIIEEWPGTTVGDVETGPKEAGTGKRIWEVIRGSNRHPRFCTTFHLQSTARPH